MSKQQELKVGKPSCIELLVQLVAELREDERNEEIRFGPRVALAIADAEELIGRVVRK